MSFDNTRWPASYSTETVPLHLIGNLDAFLNMNPTPALARTASRVHGSSPSPRRTRGSALPHDRPGHGHDARREPAREPQLRSQQRACNPGRVDLFSPPPPSGYFGNYWIEGAVPAHAGNALLETVGRALSGPADQQRGRHLSGIQQHPRIHLSGQWLVLHQGLGSAGARLSHLARSARSWTRIPTCWPSASRRISTAPSSSTCGFDTM